MYIIKRNNQKVEFDKQKIINAINKAFLEVDGEIFETDIANEIADKAELLIKHTWEETPYTVEDIQDFVEDELMATHRKDVARAYVRFRYKKEIIRNHKDDLIKAYEEKISGKAIQNQNANVDEQSFGGRKGEAASAVDKQYALDYMMSDLARERHINNQIYTHDLDAYSVGMHNCLSIPFDDLLANGFNTRQTDVRPAGSVNTAMQLVAVIFQLQSLQQFGGVAATHLDWTMVPYVRKSFYKYWQKGLKYLKHTVLNNIDEELKEKTLNKFNSNLPIDSECYKNIVFSDVYRFAMDMLEQEVHQAVEGLYHNLNTLQSRSGNQLPFTSINYGTCTLPEGRMITKALLEVSIEGLGNLHRTSVFPCGIFQLMKGVNRRPEDPNYDLFRLALRSTAQRLYPNYANCDWSNAAGYDINDPRTYFSTMGCRTVNLMDINGLGQLKDGRGNIAPVTIIMPTIAMMAKINQPENATITKEPAKVYDEDHNFIKDIEVTVTKWDEVEAFMNLLSEKIDEAKDILIERFEHICSQSPESAKFMYENGLMAGYIPEEGIRSALKHGTLVIGNLGLAETLQILVGCDHTEEKGMKVAHRIYQLFKDKCAEYKNKYKLNFGVYMTPAENLCYTAMKKFQDKYGIIPNVSDREYFTNSMHVPVWKEIGVFEKIDIESELTGYSTAGCITYVELDSGIKNNLDALETIVNYAMDKDIPYFAVNVPNDTCLSCGYCDEFNDDCPVCGSEEIQQLRRVTGYLTGNYKTAFNKGKIAETEDRVRHA